MSQESIRDTLNTLVLSAFTAQYPGVPIVFDNMPFDRNTPPSLWVEYEVKFAGANQIGMAAMPKTRIHGFVYVTVWIKESTGSKTSARIVDWFSKQLEYASSNGVLLQAAEPVWDKGPVGWYTDQIKLYFYSNAA